MIFGFDNTDFTDCLLGNVTACAESAEIPGLIDRRDSIAEREVRLYKAGSSVRKS